MAEETSGGEPSRGENRGPLREVLGRTLEATQGVGQGSGGFRIDVEQARSLIPKLEDALSRLDARSHALRAALYGLAFLDEVGRNFETQRFAMTNSADRFVRTWRDQIAAVATALQRQVEAYEAGDSAARSPL